MDVILESVKGQFAMVYLENIVIISTMPEKHIEHVQYVFTLLQLIKVAIKLKKCSFLPTG